MGWVGRHYKDKSRQLRYYIESAEKMEDYYRSKLAKYEKLGWYWLEDETRAAIQHYNDRRRFFLKKLLEHQLKEFKRD